MAAVRQQKSKYRQTGGWNVARVQKFWEDQGVSNAVLLDGGDSTQVSYASGANSFTTVRSGYLLSQTLGYWRDLPLRLYLPMLPASQSHNGVMSYLFIESAGSRTKD
jgi:hypothetical protein